MASRRWTLPHHDGRLTSSSWTFRRILFHHERFSNRTSEPPPSRAAVYSSRRFRHNNVPARSSVWLRHPSSKAPPLSPFLSFSTFQLRPRSFHATPVCRARHWSDTLADDVPDDDDDSPRARSRSNPKPEEMEERMRAMRWGLEDKYGGFRPICGFYVLVGTVTGYIVYDGIKKFHGFRSKKAAWITPEKGVLLEPAFKASIFLIPAIGIEMVETFGTLGAHYPLWTVTSFLVGMAIRGLVGFVEEFRRTYGHRNHGIKIGQSSIKYTERLKEREKNEDVPNGAALTTISEGAVVETKETEAVVETKQTEALVATVGTVVNVG